MPEVRPIVGWHLQPWDIIINPTLDTKYEGRKILDFAPAMRVAYNSNDRLWQVTAPATTTTRSKAVPVTVGSRS